ncbi:MAG: VOC family protein [Candidatus Electryoneaceae bacterium]|nr:VOC family protein [Candidatus Electryoneaceae bacterium]
MIRHIAGISEVVEDIEVAVNFYREVLKLDVQHTHGEPYAVVNLPGVLHFGLWDRKHAAETTFGDTEHTDKFPLGFRVGFEVDDIVGDTAQIESRYHPFVQQPKEEVWGQTTSRFRTPSGTVCELSETPDARTIESNH